jgi:flagellar capping protein FliD
LLTAQATSLEDTIDTLNDSIQRIQERATLQEANLRRQFTALEQTLAQLQSEGTFLLNQLNQISLLNSGVNNRR